MAALLLNSSPKLKGKSLLSSIEARRAADSLTRISRQVINSHRPIKITASEAEINSILAMVNRTHLGVVSALKIENSSATFAFTSQVNVIGYDFFINSEATLLPTPNGFLWHNGKVGRIPLFDGLSNYVFEKLIEVVAGKNYGRSLLDGVSNIEIDNSSIRFVFQPPEYFQAGIAKVAQRLRSYYGQDGPVNSERIQYYLDFLVTLTRSLPNQQISLSIYLNALFAETHSQTIKYGLAASDENQAALYALGVQVGAGVFRHFVEGLKVRRLNATHVPKLSVAGRNDLAKHFIYAAALKILSDKGISFSLGEIKEIMDSGNYSGFSFADIAADKAGIRFASMAMHSSNGARLLQLRTLEGILESDFFPTIAGLPENLNEVEFKLQYTSLESSAYQHLLSEIDKRIDQLALYDNKS